MKTGYVYAEWSIVISSLHVPLRKKEKDDYSNCLGNSLAYTVFKKEGKGRLQSLSMLYFLQILHLNLYKGEE